VGAFPGGALAGPAVRAEVLPDQRLDLVVRDRWHAGVGRAGAVRHRVDDQGQGATGLEQVVDGLGGCLFVGPVEGLAEGDQLVWSWCDAGQVLGQALDPADVRYGPVGGGAAAFGEHGGVRVQAGGLGEQVSEADGQ
jgi:hypothetical protein